jgi:hypothetical protein
MLKIVPSIQKTDRRAFSLLSLLVREDPMAIYSRNRIGILLAFLAGAISTDAHICIPGIFWQGASAARRTSHNLQKTPTHPESVSAEHDPPDVPPRLVSPADDRPKKAPGYHPINATDPLSSSSTPSIVPVVLKPNAAKSQKGTRETGSPKSDRFRWAPAIGESLLYTGIMHSFDLASQPGTRDSLNGHWFQQYTQSVGALRGWSDSDTFMAPYVGHPIEGSIFGYIERQNDPKYRLVQWGDGREYWVSMLRSMAFGAVWHTQWKIGPASEASIANVMLHASPGFITLVDTPTLGFCTMLAEDAADRYLIMGLENRTNNRALIILARSFLNPGRTFANLMAFRAPWIRDTRLNLFGTNYEIRKQLFEDYKNGSGEKPFQYVRNAWMPTGVEFSHPHPKEAPIELTAFPHYETFFGGGTCIGGGGSGAARVSPNLQVITEVSGCLIMNMPHSSISADSLFYGGGFRWTPVAAHRFSPYAQFMFGGRKITMEVMDAALREKLLQEWNDGSGSLPHYPKRSDYSVENSQNGPSIAVGGGLDVVVTRPFAWRVLNIEYTHSWINDVAGIHPQRGLKISTQAVVRIGTW